MAVRRKRWILSTALFGFCFIVICFLYSFISSLSPPRTRFMHRFHPPPPGAALSWSLDDIASNHEAARIAPLPTEEVHFSSVKAYSNFLSESSSYTEVEDEFYRRMTTVHARCSPMPRLGRYGDGGWDTCLAKSFRPEKKCLVYDFGVDNVWEYDEFMAQHYGCTVRAFDPSMTEDDFLHIPGPVHFYNVGLGGSNRQLQNGWHLRTLSSLLKRFGEYHHTIDVLKMDVDYYEWEVLKHLLSTRILTRTKQLLLEVHTRDVRGTAPSKEDFLFYHGILDRLEALGFRRFNSHANPRGRGILFQARSHESEVEKKKSSSIGRTCCYELYYININFIKDRTGIEVVWSHFTQAFLLDTTT